MNGKYNGFCAEMIEKAKAAKTVEELMKFAEANSVELTAEQANSYFAQLHPNKGALTDDEIENVSGGGCGGPSAPPDFQVGDHVLRYGLNVCDMQYPFTCRSTFWTVEKIHVYETHGYYYTVSCPVCHAGRQMREDDLIKV